MNLIGDDLAKASDGDPSTESFVSNAKIYAQSANTAAESAEASMAIVRDREDLMSPHYTAIDELGDATTSAALDRLNTGDTASNIDRLKTSADKLDRVHTSIDKLDRVHTSVDKLDRVHTSIDKLDTVYDKRDNIDTVAENIGSVNTVAGDIANKLNKPIRLIKDWIDGGFEVAEGELVLLENCRFNVGEKKSTEELSKKYAALCDVFVMDAFGTAHRAQASTHGVAKYAPTAAAGILLTAELEALTRALLSPARPMVAIVGGSKVSTKLTVLEALSEKCEQLVVGGGIAGSNYLSSFPSAATKDTTPTKRRRRDLNDGKEMERRAAGEGLASVATQTERSLSKGWTSRGVPGRGAQTEGSFWGLGEPGLAKQMNSSARVGLPGRCQRRLGR
jgi:hypothetical protein